VQAKFQTCCKTLMAYCRNVYKSLGDESKRRIKLDNKALNERVASMPGGLDFLAEVGFQARAAPACT
jgi:PUB domain